MKTGSYRNIATGLVTAFCLAAGGYGIAGTAAANDTGVPDVVTAAQEATSQEPRRDLSYYASNLHLAYIRTDSRTINNDAERGLGNLSRALAGRTSVEPSGVVGLDIEQDELSPFPFIYWPVEASTAPLSETAREKVRAYVNRGGVILFDLRGGQYAATTGNPALRNILETVRLRPLKQVEEGHTLTQTFYLMGGLPGSQNNSPVWVETADRANSENISAVIIGNRNWAGAWAARTMLPDSRDHEMALRAGVNMVIYALTGNYKSDEIHIPSHDEKRSLQSAP